MRLTDDQYNDIMKKRGGGFLSKKAPAPASATSNPKQRMQALGRLKTGERNDTETKYGDHLHARMIAGEVVWYRFEGVKFRLADNTFYTPDYAVMLADGQLEAHEVKGHWVDDARVKIKVAASMYPIRFLAVKPKRKKDGGGWEIEEF